MKRFLVVAGMVLATLLLVMPASADNPTYGKRIGAPDAPMFNYSGIYLDIAGGKAFTAGEVDFGVGPNLDSVAFEGWRGQARIGADWQLGQSPLLVGLFAGYGLGETEFNFGTVSATVSPTWHLGGRVGLTNGRALYYVGAAWQQAEFDGSGFDSQTVDGWKGLIGMEYVLNQQLSLGLEYGHTWYDEVTAKNTTTNVDLRDHEVLVRLKWRPMTGLFN